MKNRILPAVCALFAASALQLNAAVIDILWYTGGAQISGGGAGSYEAAINNLVAQEENAGFNISGSVNTWNVTFWNGSGAMPVGGYNVLVAASAIGSWDAYPNYTGLTSSVTAASFGDRVMLTGQDADWHYMNYPGPSGFNGPAGFLIDAINWAGSGTGMGGLFLDTGLEGSIFGPSIGTSSGGDDSVSIPSAFATFPINTGLTTAGLSYWSTSSHESFVGADPSLWTAINVNSVGEPVTIVSAATASGGTSGGSTVPDAGSTVALLGCSLLALAGARRMMA